MSKHESLNTLIELHLDGQLSAEQSDRLASLLNESESARKTFWQTVHIHHAAIELADRQWGQISAAHDSDEAAESAPIDSIFPAPFSFEEQAKQNNKQIGFKEVVSILGYQLKQTARKHRAALATAALITIVGLIGLALLFTLPNNNTTQPLVLDDPTDQDTPSITPTPVATLTATHNAQWAQAPAEGASAPGSSGSLSPGTKLHPNQRLTLTAGFAEITTNRGAIAILEAPATVELLDNDNALRLHSGKLVGICETELSKGFLVRTPHMDVTDLGTRFGVDVMPYRSTEVHVHQGDVVIATPSTSPSRSSSKQLIRANQAVRYDAPREAVSAIAPAFEKFAEALRTHRLRGTGLHLAEGEVDPHWHVVADANGQLDEPLPLVVQFGIERGKGHYPAVGNDPSVAQWLFFSTDNTPYYPYDTPAGMDSTRLTFASMFQLPDGVELDGKVLYLRFASIEGIYELHINGRAIEGLPKRGQPRGEQLFHEVELPIDQASLKPGENRIEIDLANNITSGEASFYLQWALRPAPNTTQAAPAP